MMTVVRPSRRAPWALLRMRQVFDGIKKIPHPEEAAKRPSRRTHGDRGGVGRDCVTRPVVALGAAVAGCCVLAVPVRAHGFGQRYDLPLPLSLYLFGAAAAVILSFVVIELCARHPAGVRG